MNRPEEALHRAACRFLNISAPSVHYWHTPNQRGTRKGWEQGLLTGLGMKRGVPDLAVILPGGRIAFLEFKSLKGSLSLEQRVWRQHVELMGAKYAHCRSLEDVEAALVEWGVELKGRVS